MRDLGTTVSSNKHLKKDKIPSREKESNTGPRVIRENVLYWIVVTSDLLLLLFLVRWDIDK